MQDSTSTRLREIVESAVDASAFLPGDQDEDTPLLGYVTGLDSMAVLAILTGIQEKMGVPIADDEVGADIFETFGSLKRFVESKLG